jgi:hypothetical protein
MATVKEVLTVAQSSSSVIPVPFLKEAIGVALKIIQLCEVRWILPFEGCKTIDQIIHQEASDVEQKVKELQVRVGDLMIVIVDHVTLKDEEGSKVTVVKTVEGVEQDIKELLRYGLRIVVSYGFWWHYSILGTINEDLTKISAQNRWVIAVYRQPNMKALDECMDRLSTAMQKFTVCILTNDAINWGD